MLILEGEQTKVLQTGFCNLLIAVSRFGVLTLFSWGRQCGVDCLCFFSRTHYRSWFKEMCSHLHVGP